MRIRLATGLMSESGTVAYEVVRHVDAPVSWPEMTEDEREEFANEHLSQLENELAFSEWEEVNG